MQTIGFDFAIAQTQAWKRRAEHAGHTGDIRAAGWALRMLRLWHALAIGLASR